LSTGQYRCRWAVFSQLIAADGKQFSSRALSGKDSLTSTLKGDALSIAGLEIFNCPKRDRLLFQEGAGSAEMNVMPSVQLIGDIHIASRTIPQVFIGQGVG